MITVLTTFYHPDLGTVRGAVVNGVPMLSCRETAHLLGCFDYNETERIMRENYISKDIVVPVGVDGHGLSEIESLLFIDAVAVLRLVECSGNRARERYGAWLVDFVFPSLLQLDAGHKVSEDSHAFYWICTDPVPVKSPGPTIAGLLD